MNAITRRGVLSDPSIIMLRRRGIFGQNRSAELALCNAFFGTLANISTTLKQANALLPAGAEPFILTADAGTSWTCHEGGATGPCYAVPWAGKNKSVAAHLFDIVDVRNYISGVRLIPD